MIQNYIKSTFNYCIAKLPGLQTAHKAKEPYYASLALCVIDSVFSIGVRYEGVKSTVNRFCQHFDLDQIGPKNGTIPKPETQTSTSEVLSLIRGKSPDYLAERIYQNRQRTSTTNGILKAEAVTLFLRILRDFGIEYFQDIPLVQNDPLFEAAIKRIPGQGSGVSLKYFFMLSGNKDLIKPDRMILRFLNDATGIKLNADQSQLVLTAVAKLLRKEGYKIRPRMLDRLIWDYQRNLV